MRAEQSSRFIGFDILKFVSAFMVVCIHVTFPGEIGACVKAIARIAVPIFFMITGYYYYDVKSKGKSINQIKKIFWLFVEANLLYFVWKCFYAIVSGEGIQHYLLQNITIKSLGKFILLNESPFNGHLWYLGAILYVLILFLVLDKAGLYRLFYMITPVLLVGDLVLGKYSLLLLKREFPYILVRNFLFLGIPYFTIGVCLSAHASAKHKKVWFAEAWAAKQWMVCCVIFSLTTLVERFLLISLNADATREHYVSSTFLAISVFELILTIYKDKYNEYNRIEKWMADIGQKRSTWIYIIHPIFITVFAVVMPKSGINGIYRCVAPILVFGVSICFVGIVNIVIRIIWVHHREEKKKVRR